MITFVDEQGNDRVFQNAVMRLTRYDIQARVVEAGETSGYTVSGTYERDILGTELTYSIPIDCFGMDPADKVDLFNLLSEPKPYHVIKLPLVNTQTHQMEMTALQVMIESVVANVINNDDGTQYVNVSGIVAKKLGYWKVP